MIWEILVQLLETIVIKILYLGGNDGGIDMRFLQVSSIYESMSQWVNESNPNPNPNPKPNPNPNPKP